MMAKIKKGDFIELDYTARIKLNNQIFDLTSEDVAKKNNIFNPKSKYKPLIICVGDLDVIPGLDESLVGKETGKEYKIEVGFDKAFGKKDTKALSNPTSILYSLPV